MGLGVTITLVRMVRVDRFGSLPTPQPRAVAHSDPTLVKALAFLVPIGDLYADGTPFILEIGSIKIIVRKECFLNQKSARIEPP